MHLKKSLLLPIFSAFALCAAADPAMPGPATYTQPDGTPITVRIHGDEFFSYYTTDDGYLLLGEGDNLCYASMQGPKIVSSGILATDAPRRSPEVSALLQSLEPETMVRRYVDENMALASDETLLRAKRVGQFPGSVCPTTGHVKALVFLVEYQDVKFSVADPHDYYTRFLTEPDFSDNGATGCVAQWYADASRGRFDIDFDVYGPLTLSQPREYYGGNAFGRDYLAVAMPVESCRQLDETVDFSKYDSDKDGQIDYVFVIYAGQGESQGGPQTSVWPHHSDLTPRGEFVFDGVRLTRYSCCNEWLSSGPNGIGTFCHEAGHILGLPDLYDTRTSGSSFHPGPWDLMASGEYNNQGRTPPTLSAFERYALGWNDPMIVDKAANFTLRSIVETGDCAMMPTGKDNEFFLLENRQPTKWDAYLPGHGMLIWHIDYDETAWNDHAVNNNSVHQRVDIEEADNKKTTSTRAGDSFPGTANITSFTSSTIPSTQMWNGQYLDTPITDIAENNGVITFKAKGGVSKFDAPTVDAAPSEALPTEVTIGWSVVMGASNYYVTLSDKSGPVVSHQDVGNVFAYTFSGLTPNTKYELKVSAGDRKNESAASKAVTFITPEDDGVEAVGDGQRVRVSAVGAYIEVEAPRGETITVADAMGRVYAEGRIAADNTRVEVDAPGLYIVRVGGHARKILLR